MDCPNCKSSSHLEDSRPIPGGIRRRRECDSCRRRFTTVERLLPTNLRVIKSQGRSSEEFDRSKIVLCLRRICRGRPVSAAQIEELTTRVELTFLGKEANNVESRDIAKELIAHLAKLDPLSSLRLSCNYSPDDSKAERTPEVGAVQFRLFSE